MIHTIGNMELGEEEKKNVLKIRWMFDMKNYYDNVWCSIIIYSKLRFALEFHFGFEFQKPIWFKAIVWERCCMTTVNYTFTLYTQYIQNSNRHTRTQHTFVWMSQGNIHRTPWWRICVKLLNNPLSNYIHFPIGKRIPFNFTESREIEKRDSVFRSLDNSVTSKCYNKIIIRYLWLLVASFIFPYASYAFVSFASLELMTS